MAKTRAKVASTITDHAIIYNANPAGADEERGHINTEAQTILGLKTFNGGVGFKSDAKSANYTVLDDDGVYHLDVTTGSGGVTIILPTLADNTGRVLVISKADSGAGSLTIDGEGAETINGQATLSTNSQYASFTMIATATEWRVLYTYGFFAE